MKQLQKSDFTNDELRMLKTIFAGAEAMVEAQRYDNYDTQYGNVLFDLKEKLGISDLLRELEGCYRDWRNE